MGVDPGKSSGGAALVDAYGDYIDSFKFSDKTDDDISDLFREWGDITDEIYCVIEKVHAMPKQGVSSSFKFGQNFGFLRGCLTTLKIQREYVTPQKWQKAMGCLTKGDKNVSKAKAQELFPGIKMTHAKADALLMALYAKKVR